MRPREALEVGLRAIRDGQAAASVEGTTLDFKEAKEGKEDTAKQAADAAICFANASGGVVVFGVADKAAGAEAFVGCDLEPEWLRKRIHELTTPGLLVEVEQITYEGATLTAVIVPEGVEVHTDKRGRATRRMGVDCMPMTAEEIAQLQEERRGSDWSASRSDKSVQDLDPLAVARARQLLEASADPARRQLAELSQEDLLKALGVVDADGALLRAGEILLCAASASETPGVVYQYRPTPAGDPSAVERLTDPLVLALGKVIDLVRARLNLTPLNLPGGEQLQLEDFPSLAVREALSNALAHRSYARQGSVQVEHSPEVLVVNSPGPLVAGVTPENILTTPSKPRNPRLAAAIRLLGFAEETGRGVDRMYREMIRGGKSTPRIDNQFDSVRVTLVGGAPNTQIARYVATLPQPEREDTDAMLVLFQLCSKQSVDADMMSPVLQKTVDEAESVLRRLARDEVAMVEPTRATARRAHPKYRLRANVLQALGSAVPYHRRSIDDIDRKVIAHVREYGKITNQTIRNLFDVEMRRAKVILTDLVAREILVKTSPHSRGPRVEYGPGRKFPKSKARKKASKDKQQPSLDL